MVGKSKRRKKAGSGLGYRLRRFWNFIWRGSRWHKTLVCLAAAAILFLGGMYTVAEWYIHKHNKEPLALGVTFIPDYAQSFGLEPHQTLKAILGDLGVKRVRLVSYWKDIETSPGKYDFSKLDWQFAMANKYNAQISLAIGLRQPRWPECHEPDWVDISQPARQWTPELFKYMTAVIEHYKNNPALHDYELENEYFMKVFGECKNFDRDRLIQELALVKQLDPGRMVEISRSNNWVGLPVGQPTPDVFGISVYKRVWDQTLTHRYFEYPLPPWFYAALAGGGEIVTGRKMIIHELQAEPWPPAGTGILQAPLSEQFKSMNADRLKKRIKYGENTGIRTIDLWGAEWWYWLKTKKGDSSVWNVVKQAVAEAKADNQKIAQTK